MHPEDAYRRVKTRSTDRRFLAVLREVAAWREREAQRRDLPRNRVIRDEALLEIAHHAPTTPQELSRTRGLGRGLAEGTQGAALISAVETGRQVPEADRPRPIDRVAAPRGVGPVVEILKVLLKLKCDDLGVAQKLVASSADLERLAVDGEQADVAMLHGWRRDIFGGRCPATSRRPFGLGHTERPTDRAGSSRGLTSRAAEDEPADALPATGSALPHGD